MIFLSDFIMLNFQFPIDNIIIIKFIINKNPSIITISKQNNRHLALQLNVFFMSYCDILR